MSLQIRIEVSDKATPALHAMHGKLTDRSGLNAYIATSAEAGTRQYITRIAASTHETAQRLGAAPTNYLTKRAQLTESTHNADSATVIVSGAIFRRVLGPVKVEARRSKWLTIPATAEAYGKSAREFNDLRVQFFGRGLMGLVRAEQSVLGTRARRGFRAETQYGLGWKKSQVLFWLKKSVVLPQDTTLLPDAQAYSEMGELAARAYLKKVTRELGLAGV